MAAARVGGELAVGVTRAEDGVRGHVLVVLERLGGAGGEKRGTGHEKGGNGSSIHSYGDDGWLDAPSVRPPGGRPVAQG